MEFSKIEKRILKFWHKEDVFGRLLKEKKGKPIFSFYDGPPFASGLPHYGHILASTIKDAVLRYWTMKGYRVSWRVGWDCHGLPVENLVEKELKINSKKEIEEMGIDRFNKACRRSVFRCTDQWKKTLSRLGRWSDYSQPYSTMDDNYIESVWWVFKKLWDQSLVYQDYRVTPYCVRCGTPLSNFELNQPGAYQEIKDESVFIRFVLPSKPSTFLLVWTTTPWTLPANTAVAVGPKIKYVQVKLAQDRLILAKERLEEVLAGEKYTVEKEFLGKDLVGLKYKALYPSVSDKEIYRVVAADFVLTSEGTGLVHIAPAFGEEDMELGKKESLPLVVTVDEEGKIVKGYNLPGEGELVKAANEKIKDNLDKRGFLFKSEKTVHSYPHCWRCDTPLIYYPLNSWYIAVSKMRSQLVKNNKKINWVPRHIKEGRFGRWLAEARDWSVSRNRYWGAPIPVWQCQKCRRAKCVGSIKELNQAQIKDLHRPAIDKIFLPCSCGGKMKRTSEVFDCWFESGSMPYGQWHYPFENKKLVEKTFPADFIAEGMDQTRGWFYTLHVLSAALTKEDIGLGKNQPAFKNCIVNGLILGDDGRKLSKRLGNYTSPEEIFERYGADTLRYFLLASTPIGEDYIASDKRIAETYRRTIMTFWNSFIFFDTYKEGQVLAPSSVGPTTVLDKWAVSRLNSISKEINEWMSQYQLTKAARLIDVLIDDLSNWYIRRSRKRFQKPISLKDKKEGQKILAYLLLNTARLAAPFMPFLSEEIYHHLGKKASVHLDSYPMADQKHLDKKLEEEMLKTRLLITEALSIRSAKGIKIRQPLAMLTIDSKKIFSNKELVDLIKEEVNVKEVALGPKVKLNTKITKELENEGLVRELIRHIQEMRKDSGFKPGQFIYLRLRPISSFLDDLFKRYQKEIQREILAGKIDFGPKRKEVFLAEKEIVLGSGKVWLGVRKM